MGEGGAGLPLVPSKSFDRIDLRQIFGWAETRSSMPAFG